MKKFNVNFNIIWSGGQRSVVTIPLTEDEFWKFAGDLTILEGKHTPKDVKKAIADYRNNIDLTENYVTQLMTRYVRMAMENDLLYMFGAGDTHVEGNVINFKHVGHVQVNTWEARL